MLEKEVEIHKEAQKKLNEEIAGLEKQGLELMKTQNLSSVKHARGTFFITTRFSVKNPATPEDKESFYNYLRETENFDNMVSVNNKTLNAWYKEQLEIAKKEGNFGFKVPGLSPPSAHEYVTLKGMK